MSRGIQARLMNLTTDSEVGSLSYFSSKYGLNGNINKLYEEDSAVHGWYRFVLSYPPYLVREYIERFNLSKKDILLDPFAGTGTTLVEGV